MITILFILGYLIISFVGCVWVKLNLGKEPWYFEEDIYVFAIVWPVGFLILTLRFVYLCFFKSVNWVAKKFEKKEDFLSNPYRDPPNPS